MGVGVGVDLLQLQPAGHKGGPKHEPFVPREVQSIAVVPNVRFRAPEPGWGGGEAWSIGWARPGLVRSRLVPPSDGDRAECHPVGSVWNASSHLHATTRRQAWSGSPDPEVTSMVSIQPAELVAGRRVHLGSCRERQFHHSNPSRIGTARGQYSRVPQWRPALGQEWPIGDRGAKMRD